MPCPTCGLPLVRLPAVPSGPRLLDVAECERGHMVVWQLEHDGPAPEVSAADADPSTWRAPAYRVTAVHPDADVLADIQRHLARLTHQSDVGGPDSYPPTGQ